MEDWLLALSVAHLHSIEFRNRDNDTRNRGLVPYIFTRVQRATAEQETRERRADEKVADEKQRLAEEQAGVRPKKKRILSDSTTYYNNPPPPPPPSSGASPMMV